MCENQNVVCGGARGDQECAGVWECGQSATCNGVGDRNWESKYIL